eukprot:1153702-Pelagomonas_calceolata.AAC.15
MHEHLLPTSPPIPTHAHSHAPAGSGPRPADPTQPQFPAAAAVQRGQCQTAAAARGCAPRLSTAAPRPPPPAAPRGCHWQRCLPVQRGKRVHAV